MIVPVRLLSGRILLRAVLVISVVATIGCDRLTKRIATERLAGSPGRSFLADTVRLEYAENAGGFLNIGEDLPPPLRRAVFVGGTGLLLLALLAGFVRHGAAVPGRDVAVAGLAFFVAGGLSNWIDRVADGRVVDFIVMRVGPLHTGVFNFADVAILLGAALLGVARLTARAAESPAGPGDCVS
jgi:signal peptidase II